MTLEQRVIVLRSAGEIGRPISRIHVTDRDQETGTGESEQLAPKTGGRRNEQTAMHLGKRLAARGWSETRSRECSFVGSGQN